MLQCKQKHMLPNDQKKLHVFLLRLQEEKHKLVCHPLIILHETNKLVLRNEDARA